MSAVTSLFQCHNDPLLLDMVYNGKVTAYHGCTRFLFEDSIYYGSEKSPSYKVVHVKERAALKIHAPSTPVPPVCIF